MRIDEAKQIFSTEFLQQLKVIHINGNLGDFVTARDGLDIVRYFRESNPKLAITISTNAGVKSTIWESLAKLGVKVQFCIDGLEGSHELYRQQTKWNVVLSNAVTFIKAGGHATWKMIAFDHNQNDIETCKKLSRLHGFSHFEVVDHGRDSFPAFDQKGRYKHSIGTHDSPVQFEKVLWIHFDAMDNKFAPVIESKDIVCQSKNSKSIYITATGEVYPCCWLGFYPREMWMQGNLELKELLPNNNNALAIGVEQAMSWFNTIEKSWSGNQLYQCNTNCGR